MKSNSEISHSIQSTVSSAEIFKKNLQNRTLINIERQTSKNNSGDRRKEAGERKADQKLPPFYGYLITNTPQGPGYGYNSLTSVY